MRPDQSISTTQARGYEGNYKWLAFAAIAIGGFTYTVEEIGIVVALPTIAEHFSAELATVQWAVAGYALTISALLLPMGRLADIVGLRKVYLGGLVIFVLASALAGLATSMTSLVAATVAQGLGAAMTQGTGRAMVISIFPASERGKVLGAQMSVIGAGVIFGPALGGIVVDLLDWRWVFFIGALAGMASLAAVLIFVERFRGTDDAGKPEFDWLGAVLSAGAMALFLVAIGNSHQILDDITEGRQLGRVSHFVIAGIPAAAVLLGGFIWWELRARGPMLDLKLFKNAMFALGIAAASTSFLGVYSMFFLMPFYLQGVLGYSVGKSGLILAVFSVVMIVVGPISGRLSDRYGTRAFKVTGMVLTAAGLLLFSRLTETSPLALMMPGMIAIGVGVGMFGPPNVSSILSTVAPPRYGVVSGLLAMFRNAFSVVSIVMATTIVTSAMAAKGYPASLDAVSDTVDLGLLRAFASGMRLDFLIVGCLLLAGAAMSMVKDGVGRWEPGR